MENTTRSASPALSGTLGEALAEFMGTLILILFGDGCVATFVLFTTTGTGGASTPFANIWTVIIFGWGFAVMLGIYVAGAVSGAHLNPAVTLALAARGKLPTNKILPYMGAQLLGAFVAAAILYAVYQGAIQHYIITKAVRGEPLPNIAQSVGGVFYTAPRPFVGLFGAFCTEFIATALLVGLIFAITDGRNQPVQANLNPLIIGFLIAAIGLSFGLNTGYAINPARDFGPRLWIALVTGGASLTSYTWVPIVAPLLGGVAGGFIYDYTIGKVLDARRATQSGDTITHGESVREPGSSDTRRRSVRESME
ncbi:MIP/aquaporin family protein [Tengunoibacter tsumagoiensis]|uniref:Aquaporin n=1 Tax=Tengunoibacter tsumagoiensis TaxID=2014871 RepID=A0A401ZXG2_9CHLR|nr:MIP family channel protein [Tengunoibacter tsumagoiensis]GCE11531.1 aquaporin [Tengunoibacter tsumagoiensis]